MTDEQFERFMRDAARSYNPPPEIIPADEMWAAVERSDALDAVTAAGPTPTPAPALHAPTLTTLPTRSPRTSRHAALGRWGQIAAALLVGAIVGRWSAAGPLSPEPASDETVALQISDVDRIAADSYLSETAAFFLSLPADLRTTRSDSAYRARVNRLLLQTRLLLDSPSAADPSLNGLAADLEVVLAQLVRLTPDPDPTAVEMLTRTLEQRDVMSRLRNAVAVRIAN
jgi:hypothetical protein